MKTTSRSFGASTTLGSLIVGVACGASIGCRPTTASVTGSVRLDGQPLEAGTIIFHATDGNYRETKGAEVNGGKYRIDGLPIKPMDIETTRRDDITPLGPRRRIELKPGAQVFDIDLSKR